MGVYVYTIRAKSIQVDIPPKGPQTVHLMKYLFKPLDWYPGCTTHGMMDWERAMALHVDKAASYWEQRELPNFVAMGDKFKDGMPIYRRTTGPVHLDTESPGKLIGYLAKVGRKWTIRGREAQELIERQRRADSLDRGDTVSYQIGNVRFEVGDGARYLEWHRQNDIRNGGVQLINA